MILPKSKKKEKRLEIDLTGPKGNAYFLLGVAHSLSRQLDREEDVKDIHKRMMSGNYENLLKVFEEEFGKYVILYK